MTTQNDNGFATFTAGEALAVNRRVKLDSTSDRQVVYADAGEDFIGLTQAAAASGAPVSLKLETAAGTFRMTGSAAMATKNAAVYGAADGKISNTASGRPIGFQLDTGTANGSVVEVMPVTANAAAVAAVVAAIDDDSGGTDSGTEQLAAVAALTSLAAIDDNAGGTNGGTEQLGAMTFTGGSAGFLTPIKNNFAVLADEHNKLRVDAAALRTRLMNGQHVQTKQINAILTALKAAGLMAS